MMGTPHCLLLTYPGSSGVGLPASLLTLMSGSQLVTSAPREPVTPCLSNWTMPVSSRLPRRTPGVLLAAALQKAAPERRPPGFCDFK